MQRQARNAFTLIEMLVVIAIIAVLAALLFPVFASVRKKGRQTGCLSNSRQLATACDLYLSDYDETLPPFTWGGVIYPYVKNAEIYHCPDDGNGIQRERGMALMPVSYAFNMNVLPIGQRPRRRSELTSAAQTVLLFEATGLNVQLLDSNEDGRAALQTGQSSGSGDGANCNLDSTPKGPAVALYATGALDNAHLSDYCHDEFALRPGRHHDGANFAAADGHARWLRGSQVSAGLDAASPGDDQTPAGCRFWFDLTHPADRPCASGTLNGKHALTFSVK